MTWGGLEINILTRSKGLPSAAQAFQNARLFKLKSYDSLEVPIADPFDLLSNKLSVNSTKEPFQRLLRNGLLGLPGNRLTFDFSQITCLFERRLKSFYRPPLRICKRA